MIDRLIAMWLRLWAWWCPEGGCEYCEDDMTTRARLWQDEWESLNIDIEDTQDELDKYGVDVPNELVVIAARLHEEWMEHQASLKVWWESTLPDDNAEADRIQGVAFYQDRTWAELAAFPDCDHAKARRQLALEGKRIVRCGVCAEHVSEDTDE